MRARTRLVDDRGQTTVLTVGLCAVLITLMLVMLAVTTVAIQARRLQSLADGAALAGAEELGFRLDENPTVVLSDDEVAASAGAYLSAVGGQESVPGLADMEAGVAGDGATVIVRLEAQVSLLPAGGWFTGVVPATVPVQAEGSSRTALTR